jgi:hypothetical protein
VASASFDGPATDDHSMALRDTTAQPPGGNCHENPTG